MSSDKTVEIPVDKLFIRMSEKPNRYTRPVVETALLAETTNPETGETETWAFVDSEGRTVTPVRFKRND